MLHGMTCSWVFISFPVSLAASGVDFKMLLISRSANFLKSSKFKNNHQKIQEWTNNTPDRVDHSLHGIIPFHRVYRLLNLTTPGPRSAGRLKPGRSVGSSLLWTPCSKRWESWLLYNNLNPLNWLIYVWLYEIFFSFHEDTKDSKVWTKKLFFVNFVS